MITPFVRSLCLAALLALAAALWCAPAVSADPKPETPNLSSALQQIVDAGLSPQVALGRGLWNGSSADIASAYALFKFDAATAKKIFENAQAPNAGALAELAAAGNAEKLAAALDECAKKNCGSLRRALNALRFHLFYDNPKLATSAQIVGWLAQRPNVKEAELVKTLASDFDYNALPEAPKSVSGKLETVGNARLLYVWGTPVERGYAYGKLLGPEIVKLFESYALPLAMLRGYSRIAEMQDLIFAFDGDYLDELKGMLLGIKDAMPNGNLYHNALRRDLGLVDLKVGNTLSDWSEIGCSSVSVWGDLTKDGKVMTGRNLDYFAGAARSLHRSHLLLVNAPRPAYNAAGTVHGWTSVTWLGAIGCYTGMNDEGVTAMMHNTPGGHSTTIGVIPRSLAQRRALESASAANMPASFVDALRAQQTLIPSNIHVSWPRGKGAADGIYAVGLETDGVKAKDNGVTVRAPENNGNGRNRNYLVVTNHMCLRETSVARGDSARRYATLADAAQAAGKGSVDVETLRGWLQQVGHSGSVHSVVFVPDDHAIYLMQPKATDKGGPWAEAVKVEIDGLFEQIIKLQKNGVAEDF